LVAVNKINKGFRSYDEKKGKLRGYVSLLLKQAFADFMRKNSTIKLYRFEVKKSQLKDWPFLVNSLTPPEVERNIKYTHVRINLCSVDDTRNDSVKLQIELNDHKSHIKPILKRFNLLLRKTAFYDENVFPWDKLPRFIADLLLSNTVFDTVRRNRFLLEIVYTEDVLERCRVFEHKHFSIDDSSINLQIVDENIENLESARYRAIEIVGKEREYASETEKIIIERYYLKKPHDNLKKISKDIGKSHGHLRNVHSALIKRIKMRIQGIENEMH
jgi:hypothetical protein